MRKIFRNALAIASVGTLLVGCTNSSAADNTEVAANNNAGNDGNADVQTVENIEDNADVVTTYDTIISNRYITFATEGTYAPYSYHDDKDDLVGFDVEIAKAIAGELGVEAKFTETQWDGIIAGLDAKKYDAISNQVSITDERKEKYLFSDPYTYVYGAVIVAEDNEDIKSFEDLDKKNVALTVTSNWADVARSYGGEIVSTNGFSESIQLVLQGRADATVNDNVTFLDFKANQPDAKAKIAATSTEATESAILIRQGDEKLQTEINKALKTLRDNGKLSEISIKYFGEDITSAK
ncbi:MAG: amino acid ABC transporter substrate-binding protein [Lachnospiraceae bacterium]|nr:amino acid ABC transporter substrate-binding protein [Lachnospiraceae bacterium]